MAKGKPTRSKRTKRVVEADGVAHVKATFNNTIITIADSQGNAVTWASAGKAGFKGSKKSTPFAATVAGEIAGKEAFALGVKRVSVRVQMRCITICQVCVCVRARARKREIKRERGREKRMERDSGRGRESVCITSP